MPVKLTHIGVVGDRCRGTQMRLEFRIFRGTTPDETLYDYLACQEIGTFGAVFSGQLRQGNWTQPVVIKLQQDRPPSGASRDEISTRFDREHQLYSKLCSSHLASTKVLPVPHYFDVFSQGSTILCPQLPSSILCRHAYHALQPRCPECGGELADNSWASPHLGYVTCKLCNRHYVPNDETKTRIVTATVRRDSACHGCTQSDAECRRSAMVLNMFPACFLILEDVSPCLSNVLAKDNTRSQQAQIEPQGKHDRHRLDFPTRLRTVLSLFRHLVEKVHMLHQRGIAHLALSPRHVGLKAINGCVHPCLMDLGAAHDRDLPPCYLPSSKAASREREYLAPEVLNTLSAEVDGELVSASPSECWEIAIRRPASKRDELVDPFVLAGDTLEVSFCEKNEGLHYLRVTAVSADSSSLRLRLSPSMASLPAEPCRCTVRIVKRRGPAADLFSLGMILMRLLLPDLDIYAFREQLGSWMRKLRACSFSFTPSPRTLARALTASQSQPDELLAGLVTQLSTRYSKLSFIALDLFGMALRLVLRCDHPIIDAYVKDRADDSLSGLERLRKELEVMSAYAEASWAMLEGERVLKIPIEKVEALRELLRHMPSAPSEVAADSMALGLAPGELTYALYCLDQVTPAQDGAEELSVMYRVTVAQLPIQPEPMSKPVPKPPKPTPDDLSRYRDVVRELHLLASGYPCEPSILSQLEEMHIKLSKCSPPLLNTAQEWITAAGFLIEKSKAYQESLHAVRRYFLGLKRLFCDYLGSVSRFLSSTDVVVFRLGANLWRTLESEGTDRQLECWDEYWRFSDDLLHEMRERCQKAHREWQQLPSPLRESLAPLAGRLATRHEALVREHQRQITAAKGLVSELRRAFRVAKNAITIPWKRQLANHADRYLEKGHLASITLHRSFCEELRGPAVEEALHRLGEIGLGPAAMFRAAVLVQEAEVLVTLRRVHVRG